MTRIDQFESVFRAAAKPAFHFTPIKFASLMVITDLDVADADAYAQRVAGMLNDSRAGRPSDVVALSNDDFASLGDVLSLVEQRKPDLIATYRNVKSDGWKWPHSLGEYVDLLTQVTPTPVLLLPHPRSGDAAEHALMNLDVVVAMTDHLAGDDRLLNYALSLCHRDGKLVLGHIEDEQAMTRFLDVISRISNLETEVAEESIPKRLLDDATDFAESAKQVVTKAALNVEVLSEVQLGRRLEAYQGLIEKHRADVLVMNTKDAQQGAMHSMAHAVAVGVRNIPLLLV